MDERPKVGVGVAIFKDGKVLVGKRKASHEAGTHHFPGGHLEFKESFEECAKREAMEEAGIAIKNVRFWTLTNDYFEDKNKHFVTIFMVADYDSGEPTAMEPEKCEGWNWTEWDSIPRPLMIPLENLLTHYSLDEVVKIPKANPDN